jgi:hypothetical protein
MTYTQSVVGVPAAPHIFTNLKTTFQYMEYNEPMPGTHRPAPVTPDRMIADAARMLALSQTLENEVNATQLMSESHTGIACLVEPFFQKVGLACLAGSSDTGKSAILRQLAEDICAGSDEHLGFKINATHKSVIYVSTEDGRDATRYLLHRQTQKYEGRDFSGLRFIFDYDDLVGTLHRNLVKKPADMIVIDCFADVYSGDLKDTQKIREFLKPFQELSDKHECLILFLHHTGKRTEELLPSKNNLLGGQGFEAKMRLVVELRKESARDNHRHFCLVKGNYLPESEKRHSHVLLFDPDTLTFSRTNERTPFDKLSRGYELEEGKAKYEQAKELKKEGYTHQEIAEKLGHVHKATITKLFEKAKKLGWDIEIEEE